MAQHDTEPTWTQWQDESGGNRGKMAGAVLASAVAAGAVAFLLRRQRHEEEERHTPSGLVGSAYERTRDVMGDERLEAGREFLMSKIVPEFKPAMLAILEDVEEVVETAFRRAEKAIKKL
jgi:hypothetical protein